MNWEAGAAEASSNPMGALELGRPFGLGPSESRRLGLCVPRVQSLDVVGGAGCSVTPTRQGSSLGVSANPSCSQGNENGVPGHLLLWINLVYLETPGGDAGRGNAIT